jgi:hypothetical protein
MIRRGKRTLSLASAMGVFLAGLSMGGAAEMDKKACAAAFAGAQRQMRAGALLEAKKNLHMCGGPQCPRAMHSECQRWLSGVEASIPTVVFRVLATDGRSPGEVSFTLDGGDPSRLDGRAVGMDPGTHEVRFEAVGFQTSNQRVVVSEGEKLRNEFITLIPMVAAKPEATGNRPGQADPLAPPPSPARPSRFTLPVAVAAAVSVAGGFGAVYFGMKARSDDRRLEDCSPTCTWDAVNQVKREYLWTNLSLGMAAAGITTATVLFILNGRPGRLATPSTSPSVGIGWGPSGVGPILTGRF